MPLYCGIDLHARSNYVAIVDEQRKRLFKRNLQKNSIRVSDADEGAGVLRGFHHPSLWDR